MWTILQTIAMLQEEDGPQPQPVARLYSKAREHHWAGWMQDLSLTYEERCGKRTAAPKGVLPC